MVPMARCAKISCGQQTTDHFDHDSRQDRCPIRQAWRQQGPAACMSAPDLRYPIGRASGQKVTPANRKRILLEIAELPNRLRDAIEGLSDKQLDTPYRP